MQQKMAMVDSYKYANLTFQYIFHLASNSWHKEQTPRLNSCFQHWKLSYQMTGTISFKIFQSLMKFSPISNNNYNYQKKNLTNLAFKISKLPRNVLGICKQSLLVCLQAIQIQIITHRETILIMILFDQLVQASY